MAQVFYDNETKVKEYRNWDEYDLKEKLLEAIFALGFDKPSEIQKTAIAPLLNGRDVRAQAQSGTGKTATFGIAALQKITEKRETQVLILVSTREIAEQNAMRIGTLALHMPVNITVLAGGCSVETTKKQLKEMPEIVVGTPGRVLHMIQDGFLLVSNLSLLIIDEADEMLSKGFKEQLSEIFAYLPKKLQIGMFSATWEDQEMEIANHILTDPVVIDVKSDQQALKGIDQFYINLGQRPPTSADVPKLMALIDLFQFKNIAQCIVFVNTRNKAKFVNDYLRNKGIPSDVIHAELEKNERAQVLERFRRGGSRMLIATGLVGRGIDIQHLSLVINFDIPKFTDTDIMGKRTDKSNYLHRIGRAGRFGRKGIAINLVFDDELTVLNEIEEHYTTSISPLPQNINLS
ncbi:hypothetical protein EDEG_00301 [Edhazardia aedis USNM 41457]|uniref:RNA helicase n=1 Tax=Edhazardia aedis (strain USNM 41457) TaxID=1003232 RepID=J9D445_EDHAE|nr:hypothetical protein EDEG_00301 [Edhazardia aedis USNM 41457]|eukprot:EJW02324.1 hypothetical protein EDEG_00301 [Edhazardia aedis USNM 41457]